MEQQQQLGIIFNDDGIWLQWNIAPGLFTQVFLTNDMMAEIITKWRDKKQQQDDAARAAKNHSGIHLLN